MPARPAAAAHPAPPPADRPHDCHDAGDDLAGRRRAGGGRDDAAEASSFLIGPVSRGSKEMA